MQSNWETEAHSKSESRLLVWAVILFALVSLRSRKKKMEREAEKTFVPQIIPFSFHLIEQMVSFQSSSRTRLYIQFLNELNLYPCKVTQCHCAWHSALRRLGYKQPWWKSVLIAYNQAASCFRNKRSAAYICTAMAYATVSNKWECQSHFSTAVGKIYEFHFNFGIFIRRLKGDVSPYFDFTKSLL